MLLSYHNSFEVNKQILEYSLSVLNPKKKLGYRK
jgi:hypothetical protein